MAVEHRSAPVFGLQFHPEAILTEGGYTMLNNFFRRATQSQSAGFADSSSDPRSKAQLEILWQRELRGATDGTATDALATSGKVELEAMPHETPEPVAAHPEQWFPMGGSGASTWRPSP